MISKFMFEMWQIVEQLANFGVGAKFWVRVKILMGAQIWVGGEIFGWGNYFCLVEILYWGNFFGLGQNFRLVIKFWVE